MARKQVVRAARVVEISETAGLGCLRKSDDAVAQETDAIAADPSKGFAFVRRNLVESTATVGRQQFSAAQSLTIFAKN